MRIVFTSDAGDYLMEILVPDREGDRVLVEGDPQLLIPVPKPAPSEAVTETFNAFGPPLPDKHANAGHILDREPQERGQSTMAWQPVADTIGMSHLVPCPRVRDGECPELQPHVHTADGGVHPLPAAVRQAD